MLHNPTKRSFTFGPNEALSRNKTMRLQAKANNILLSGFGSRHLLLIIPHLCVNLSPSIIFLFFYSSFSHHPFHKFSITPCEPLSQSFHVFPTTIKTLSLSLQFSSFCLWMFYCSSHICDGFHIVSCRSVLGGIVSMFLETLLGIDIVMRWTQSMSSTCNNGRAPIQLCIKSVQKLTNKLQEK